MRLRLLLLLALTVPGLFGQSQLINLSVRSAAGTGSETLIVGFTVAGSGNKSVLLRGVGPELARFGVPGVVTDPQLRVYAGSSVIAENDNWGGGTDLTNAFAAVSAFGLPAASRDAALLQSLPAGSYSAHVAATSGTGIALVECYDLAPALNGALTNLAARSFVGTGANVLTVGFTVSGTARKNVLIRGIGPTLAGFGVQGAIADPRLRLFDSNNNQIILVDDWSAVAVPSSEFSRVNAFGLNSGSRDAVLLAALEPGSYTAQISGVNNTTGTGLVEVYDAFTPPAGVTIIEPITRGVEPVVPGPDPGAGTPSPGPDAMPSVLSQAAPSYPFELRRAGYTGEVLVEFLVLSNGRVAGAYAVRATDVRFASAAVGAVSQWVFTPGRRNGALVVTRMQVPIVFSLQ